MTVSPLYFLPVLLIGLPVLFFSFRIFDQIVSLEYKDHRRDWENDGRPKGFMWKAPECNWFTSEWARTGVCFKWLFSTPPWAERSNGCSALFTRWRIAVLIWNVLAFGIFLAMIYMIFSGQVPLDSHGHHF